MKFNPDLNLHQLLTHTSGLPREPEDFVSIAPRNSFEAYTEEKLLAALSKAIHPVGVVGDFSYSNFGFMILGLVAKRIAGRDKFSDLCTGEVLTPLGLQDTRYDLDAKQMLRLRCGYTPRGERVSYLKYGAFESAGGVKSTVADLGTLAAMMLDSTLRPRKMLTPLTKTLERYKDRSDREISFGWHVRMSAGQLCFFHPGGLAGVKSSVLLCPALRRGIAYVSNTESHIRSIWDVLIPPES